MFIFNPILRKQLEFESSLVYTLSRYTGILEAIMRPASKILYNIDSILDKGAPNGNRDKCGSSALFGSSIGHIAN